MAERVNAFKTKYTGEQMEELFDKLANYTSDVPSAEEGQCYSTEMSITSEFNSSWFRGQTVETNFGFMSYTGLSNKGCNNILSLLSSNSTVALGLNDPTTLTYTFKKPVILLKYRLGGNSYFSGGGTLYYWINNEWVNQGTVNKGTTTLTPQTVEKVKVEFPANGNAALYYSIFDFMSDSYIVSGPAIITEE